MPRLETVIGTVFFVMLVAGVGTIIASKNQTKSTGRKYPLQAIGIGLEAFAFLVFGMMSIYFLKTSTRPAITGSISDLKQHSGKYPSSDFTVTAASGETAEIHSQYHGYRLHVGDVVRAQYVRYDRTLLDLTILSGEETGWRLTESDETFWFGVIAAMGVAFGVGAVQVWRSAPNDSEDDNISEPPDTDGPDSASILKIS